MFKKKQPLKSQIKALDFKKESTKIFEIALSEETYRELRSAKKEHKLEPKEQWYRDTYAIFSSSVELNKNVILQKVAYAYSWMPTIPGIKRAPNWDRIVEEINGLADQNFASKSLKRLLRLTVPVFNNSLIGASKALHFCFPEDIPIIDTKVVRSWRHVFFENGVHGFRGCPIAPLPSGFGAVNCSKARNIDLYVTYCENMRYWSSATKRIIRELEVALFEYSGYSNRES